jgi:hypothetical protein
MADRLNSKFNYQYLVNGKTPWEKLKTLKGFLQGRYRGRALEEVSRLKIESKYAKLHELKSGNAPRSQILEIESELIELESVLKDQAHAFKLNHEEIADLEQMIAELYDICEPTRISGYSDDQMFEANAPLEFTVTIVQQLQSEIAAMGSPTPATLLNAMSTPMSLEAIKQLGIIPPETNLLGANDVVRLASTGFNLPAAFISLVRGE